MYRLDQDVLVRLNGLDLQGAVNVQRMADRLEGSERLVMELERAGATRTVRIELE